MREAARQAGGTRAAGVGAAAVLLAAVVGVWVALGGPRPAPPMTEEAALERASELGERMRAGVQNQRDVSGLVAPLEELVAERPTLADGWTLLGQVRLLAGDGAGASDALSEALRLRDASPEAMPAEGLAELHLLAGSAAERIGRLEEARGHFARANELAPADARAALRLAHAAAELGAAEAAAALAEKATRLDAGLATAWGLRSQLAAAAGEPAAALAAAERAAALTADAGGLEARAYALALSRLLLEQGRPRVAARVLRLPKPEDFFTPNVMAAHAEALAAAGEPQGAANYYERWLSLDPTNALAAAEATRWYLAAGAGHQARATLVLLERIAPRDPRIAEFRAELDETPTP